MAPTPSPSPRLPRICELALRLVACLDTHVHADPGETLLRAPSESRVQIRIAEPGETLPTGGKVLNHLDLSDVVLTSLLPAGAAGRLQLGSEARLLLDAAPELVLPACVTSVASSAQFTPNTVETRAERQTLMGSMASRGCSVGLAPFAQRLAGQLSGHSTRKVTAITAVMSLSIVLVS